MTVCRNCGGGAFNNLGEGHRHSGDSDLAKSAAGTNLTRGKQKANYRKQVWKQTHQLVRIVGRVSESSVRGSRMKKMIALFSISLVAVLGYNLVAAPHCMAELTRFAERFLL